MVAGAIIAIAFVVAIGFFFKDDISAVVSKVTKSEEQRKSEAASVKLRGEKGAFGNTFDFLFGEGSFIKSKNQTQVRKVETALKAERLKAAKQSGFRTVEEFERATNINLDLSKFNPPGVKGFGILGKDRQGIPIGDSSRRINTQAVKGGRRQRFRA